MKSNLKKTIVVLYKWSIINIAFGQEAAQTLSLSQKFHTILGQYFRERLLSKAFALW